MNNADLSRYSKRIARMFWDPPPTNEDTAAIWCMGRSYESEYQPNTSASPPRRQHRLDAEEAAAGSRNTETKSIDTRNTDARSTKTRTNDEEGEESFVKIPTSNGVNGTIPDQDDGWPPAFLDDFEAKLWMTYRSGFDVIPRSQDPNSASSISWAVKLRNQLNQEGFNSDTGWGCMIRSGQSMLANTLALQRLGRDWRRGQDEDVERKIISLFADQPKAPFSIHKFVGHGAAACGKFPGEWFGPSATARCIKALSDKYDQTGLRVYVTGDGSEVYKDAFFRVAKDSDGTFHPTLVLVGIRLGINRITPVYWEALKESLKLPQSIGIAGGRPSASHYFVGVQGDCFFYLDPHFTRPALPLHTDLSNYTTEDISSCHTRRLRRIHIEEMDPSMLIGFLIRSEDDWRDWRNKMSSTAGKAIVNISDIEASLHEHGTPRESAIDEVESFDEDGEDFA